MNDRLLNSSTVRSLIWSASAWVIRKPRISPNEKKWSDSRQTSKDFTTFRRQISVPNGRRERHTLGSSLRKLRIDRSNIGGLLGISHPARPAIGWAGPGDRRRQNGGRSFVLRSRRCRCDARRHARLHKPAASIHRRDCMDGLGLLRVSRSTGERTAIVSGQANTSRARRDTFDRTPDSGAPILAACRG